MQKRDSYHRYRSDASYQRLHIRTHIVAGEISCPITEAHGPLALNF